MWNYFRLVLWALIWLMLWVLTFPFRKNRDNCLTWALRQQRTRGGYIVVRWARTDRFSEFLRHPHFGWLPEEFHVCSQHYVPKEEEEEGLIPKIWFHGTVKQGDGNEHIPQIRKKDEPLPKEEI